ncbi:MAG: hypothetical protein ACOYLE_12255 [Bacteroidales bacterium]
MNNVNCSLFKKVALICYFLLSNLSFSFSQNFEYSCSKKYKTSFPIVDYEISPIFNLKFSTGISIRINDEETYLKFFYINRNELIVKEIALKNNFGLSNSFSAYDTSLIALLPGSIDLRPIVIYQQNEKGIFAVKTKIDLSKQKKFIEAGDIFLLNNNTIILGASYIYSKYKMIGLAKLNIKTKKIEKTLSFPINEYEFRFSHFPKQWIAVSKKNIAVVRPFAKNIILLDTSLNKVKDIDISSFCLAKSEKEFYNNIDTNYIKQNQKIPKNIINYYLQKNITDIRKIEKIAFLNESELLVSIVDSNFNYKRQLYRVNINSNLITDSISVDYRNSINSNIIDTRYSAQLYFDEKGKSFNVNGKDSINENEINCEVKQFKLNKKYNDSSNTISSELLYKTDIRNVKGEKNNSDFICNFNKVLFMNYMFCFSDYCLRDIERNELVLYIIKNTDNYTSKLITKRTLEKKYKFENILFINEDVFKQLPNNIIPNKEYYILIK